MKQVKLTTEVAVPAPEWKIDHTTGIMTIGSCFAEVLGSQLEQYKFSVLNNPFGTIFNPLTITKVLNAILEDRQPNPALFVQNPDDIWLHHDFHSSLWSTDRDELLNDISDRIDHARTFLKNARLLVITLGTAYAYRHKQTNSIIGNCHKMPSDLFLKELLHSDQIGSALEQVIQKLQTWNRRLRIIVTVSPVRHTRDTLPLNQVSKAMLRLACHRLTEKYKHVEYFPSYEIMMDELRDYRFYSDDLIHPSKVAEDVIFNVFSNAYIDTGSKESMKEWDAVLHMMNHRNQHGQTAGQLKLLNAILQKLRRLAGTFDVGTEIAQTEKRIRDFHAN
ncbi:GSCFA domain-containing protein [Dyadobacter sandarakinus]|uniref:GSCFA domain-containing protein n=1 Tax=Dyadobacter sandarakinus TaxID=2747268 RepID=A0ABX7I9G7_9BACT|nr:GSCFA domain-containing protein [Dyadobacter sandarakinus]QRR01818.1 GSCFA domain-containing protein [Dyadobacter sandarakinus]